MIRRTPRHAAATLIWLAVEMPDVSGYVRRSRRLLVPAGAGAATVYDWPVFLGGTAKPIGCSLSFVERPADQTLDALLSWRSSLAERHRNAVTVSVAPSQRALDALDALAPMEAPWTVEVLIDCGPWTAYLNNGLNGSDQTGAPAHLAERLDCKRVMAEHMPRHGPGHASTQFWLEGPEGPEPLRGIRSLAAHATDGRWRWIAVGHVQPWEQPHRYEARRVRDRLDRELLLDYLTAFEIYPDEASFFGSARVVRQSVPWPTRTVPVAQFRAQNGW